MRRRDSHHEHDPDLVDCRDCGREFDLALQPYYGPLCPDCREPVVEVIRGP